jgi:hypothetical protein
MLDTVTCMRASASDPDTLTYDEAMRDLAHLDQWAAAAAEIRMLEQIRTWTEVPSQTLATARSFQELGPFTASGLRMERLRNSRLGIASVGTYRRASMTPTVLLCWSTIRFLLDFALTFGWTTCSIDFASAFVQAKLKDPVRIHLPRGFHSAKGTGTCLRLNKSLYGFSVAS